MGSRSKMGKKRGSAEYLKQQEPDHHTDTRAVWSFVKNHPGSSAHEVALELFDGSYTIAHRALNTLRNRGVLARSDNRFTLQED